MQPKINFVTSGNTYSTSSPAVTAPSGTVPYKAYGNTGNTYATGARLGTGATNSYTVGAPVNTINFTTNSANTGGAAYGGAYTGGAYTGGAYTGGAINTGGAYTGGTINTGGAYKAATVNAPVSTNTTNYKVTVPQPQHRPVQVGSAAVAHTAMNVSAASGHQASNIGVRTLQHDRPHYNKLYSDNHQRIKKHSAPISDEPEKPNKCCGTPCWALLGLLGLLGTVLGMLFGLGVIGGLPDLSIPGINIPGFSGDGNADASPSIVEGVNYPSGSIVIEDSVINKTNSVNPNEGTNSSGSSSSGSNSSGSTSFQYPPTEVSPQPMNPLINNWGIIPHVVNPIPTNNVTVNPGQINQTPSNFTGIDPVPRTSSSGISPSSVDPTQSPTRYIPSSPSINPTVSGTIPISPAISV